MSNQSKHILVLRFSAMGDVALLTPIVKSFLLAYPDHQLSIVSRPKFSAFFPMHEKLNYFPADVDSKYNGLSGIVRLFIQLKQIRPDAVIDLHDHLRSRLICFLFRLVGTKIVRFEKGRREKKLLTRKKNKIWKELPHTVERYKEAFARAGFAFEIASPPFIVGTSQSNMKVNSWLDEKCLIKNELWYGLAPFAAHKTKIWSLENYEGLIRKAIEKSSIRFFLFGGGRREIDFFNQLRDRFPEICTVVAGELSLSEELALLSQLDKMICVDSSNMHLAALVGIPVISIWGGTHPSTGFGPYRIDLEQIIQIDTAELPCRPCSVYGKEHCWRGDLACLNQIKPDLVLSKL